MELAEIHERLRQVPIYIEWGKLMLPVVRSKDDRAIVFLEEKEFKRTCKRLGLNHTWDTEGQCVIVPKHVMECSSGYLKECTESTKAGRNSEVILYCKDFSKLKYEEHAWCRSGEKIKVEVT